MTSILLNLDEKLYVVFAFIETYGNLHVGHLKYLLLLYIVIYNFVLKTWGGGGGWGLLIV